MYPRISVYRIPYGVYVVIEKELIRYIIKNRTNIILFIYYERYTYYTLK